MRERMVESLTVVVPVHNEAACLERLVAELDANLAGVRREYLLVNDGSTDDSAAVIARLQEACPHCSYLELSRNFGHQLALKAGLDHARGAVIITMDADLQHPPARLPDMLATWRKGNDIVTMVKVDDHSRKVIPAAAGWLFYRLFNLLADVRIEPQASDFRLLDGRCVAALRSLGESRPFIRGMIQLIGFRQTTLPYSVQPRFAGAPAYSLRKLAQLAGYGLYGFSTFPLRLSIYIAFALLAGCALYVAFCLATGFSLGQTLPQLSDRTTIVTLIILLNCVVLGTFGIHGLYLGRLLDETRRRPLYFVREYRPGTIS